MVSRWRVCYQWGLPRLVFFRTCISFWGCIEFSGFSSPLCGTISLYLEFVFLIQNRVQLVRDLPCGILEEQLWTKKTYERFFLEVTQRMSCYWSCEMLCFWLSEMLCYCLSEMLCYWLSKMLCYWLSEMLCYWLSEMLCYWLSEIDRCPLSGCRISLYCQLPTGGD